MEYFLSPRLHEPTEPSLFLCGFYYYPHFPDKETEAGEVQQCGQGHTVGSWPAEAFNQWAGTAFHRPEFKSRLCPLLLGNHRARPDSSVIFSFPISKLETCTSYPEQALPSPSQPCPGTPTLPRKRQSSAQRGRESRPPLLLFSQGRG